MLLLYATIQFIVDIFDIIPRTSDTHQRTISPLSTPKTLTHSISPPPMTPLLPCPFSPPFLDQAIAGPSCFYITTVQDYHLPHSSPPLLRGSPIWRVQIMIEWQNNKTISYFYRLYSYSLQRQPLPQLLMNNKLAFVYPPDKQKSLKHRQANRIFRKINIKEVNQERCECCGKYVGEQSDADCICYDPYFELEFLGAGVPLLFSFMRNMAILLLIFFAIVAFHALLSNVLDNSCNREQVTCKSSLINNVSISNKLLDAESIQVQIYLVFLVTGVWVIINQYIVYRLRKTEFQADYYIQTPSDYAIFINELPSQATEKDVVEMISKRNRELKQEDQKLTNGLKIKNILIPKKMDKYHEDQQKQQQRFREAIKNNEHQNFKKEDLQLSKHIAKVALVIFEQEKSKEYFLQKNTVSAQIKSLFCNWGTEVSKFTVCGQNVTITRAPEPDDIIWKNLGKSPKKIFIRKILTYVLGAILLFVNWIIQQNLALWALKQSEDTKQSISLLSSVIVNVANFLITLVLIWATKMEGNLTSTIESQSLSIKIVYFQFLNSGIFYTFSNALAVDFKTDLLQEIFSDKVTTFMLINGLSQPVISFIVDYFELENALNRWFFNKQIAYYTQKDCNQIHQMPECEIPFKYAFIVRTLWLTFFFAPFVPIVTIFSFVGIVLYYYVCKLLFRYSYRIPNVRSNQINTTSLWLTYSLPFSLNVGQFLIYLFISDRVDVELSFSVKVVVYLSLSLSLLWVFIPWYEINNRLFPFKQSTNQNYNDNAYKFQITYEMIDPFYDGEKTLQRDSHFIRTQLKDVKDTNLPIFHSHQVLKDVVHHIPMLATAPHLFPLSERNLLSQSGK